MKNMKESRKELYASIFNSVKNSPIESVEYEGNTYHFKLDYKLPYGECHYARIFAKLIYYKECFGVIKPGDLLLETTSGSGGRAAAAIATALGYRIKIAIPAGGEKAREDAIVAAGGEICLTPKESYVNGFPGFVKRFLVENRGTKYINHVMGNIFGKGSGLNIVASQAFDSFVYEVIESGIQPDFVICPLGNGTTTLPMGKLFKSLLQDVQIIGFESASSAFAYRKKFFGKYEQLFGVDPSDIKRHNLPGTTPAKAMFPAPALEASLEYLDEIKLVTNNYIDNNFMDAVGFTPVEKSSDIINVQGSKLDFLSEFGRTGRAGFEVALHIARKKKIQGKLFLIPVFDACWHYDS